MREEEGVLHVKSPLVVRVRGQGYAYHTRMRRGNTHMGWLVGWPGSALECAVGCVSCHTRMGMMHTRMGRGMIS